MKRVYEIEGTQIKRTSETHDYTHAVVYLSDHQTVSVWHMCGSLALAQKAISSDQKNHPNYKLEIRKAIRIK